MSNDAGEYLFEKVRETSVELLSPSDSSSLHLSGKSGKSLRHGAILSFCVLLVRMRNSMQIMQHTIN